MIVIWSASAHNYAIMLTNIQNLGLGGDDFV